MNNDNLARMMAISVGDKDEEIVALEARMRAAQLAGDVEMLDGLIAEQLLFTGPDGQLATKAQDLDAHATGAVRFLSHEPDELRILRIADNVAATALRARLEVAVGGIVVTGTFRYTRIWARGADKWRVVAGHVSEVHDVASGDSGEEA